MSLYVKRRLTSGRSTFSSYVHVLYHILLFVIQILFDKSLKFWCLSPNLRPSIGIVSGGHPKTPEVFSECFKVVETPFGLRVWRIRVRYIVSVGDMHFPHSQVGFQPYDFWNKYGYRRALMHSCVLATFRWEKVPVRCNVAPVVHGDHLTPPPGHNYGPCTPENATVATHLTSDYCLPSKVDANRGPQCPRFPSGHSATRGGPDTWAILDPWKFREKVR